MRPAKNQDNAQTAALAAVSLLFGLCFSSSGSAQNQTPSFRVTARLVELTVVVTDKNGNPVEDLGKDDFRVFDNGNPRTVSFFHYEGPPSSEATRPPAVPSFIFTNRLELQNSEQRNITALVIDSANTDPRDQMYVKGQTMRLLQALAPETRVAIYHMGRQFRVIHDFTDDMASLRQRLEEVKGEFQAQRLSDIERASREADALLDQIEARKSNYVAPVFSAIQAAGSTALAGEINANAAVRGNQAETALAALEALGRHLAGIPGRKSVVWISGGVSMMAPRVTTSANRMPANPMSGDNLAPVIRKTSQLLAQLGVALYAVDARGIKTPAEGHIELEDIPLLPGRYSEMERAAGTTTDPRATFALMTSITGGRYIFGTNDLSEGVKKVAADLGGSYSLGFYAPEEPDGKWHALKVTVRRPDARLLHKEGYLADASPLRSPKWDAEAERQAMTNPHGSSGVRLTARCAPATAAEPGTLTLTLQIEAEDLFWAEESDRMVGAVDVYIGEKTADGQVRFQESRIKAKLLPPQMETARSQGLPFRRQWKPGPDTLTIRVLARDVATGRIGTVDIPLSQAAGNR